MDGWKGWITLGKVNTGFTIIKLNAIFFIITFRPFKGILIDIKRKIPHFVSDFTDCFNLQCVATTLYIYLVSLCSLVAFGGMLGQKTNNLMVIIY